MSLTPEGLIIEIGASDYDGIAALMSQVFSAATVTEESAPASGAPRREAPKKRDQPRDLTAATATTTQPVVAKKVPKSPVDTPQPELEPEPDVDEAAAAVEAAVDAEVETDDSCPGCGEPRGESDEKIVKLEKLVGVDLCPACLCTCEQCGARDVDPDAIALSFTRWRRRLCSDCYKTAKPEQPALEPEVPPERGIAPETQEPSA